MNGNEFIKGRFKMKRVISKMVKMYLISIHLSIYVFSRPAFVLREGAGCGGIRRRRRQEGLEGTASHMLFFKLRIKR